MPYLTFSNLLDESLMTKSTQQQPGSERSVLNGELPEPESKEEVSRQLGSQSQYDNPSGIYIQHHNSELSENANPDHIEPGFHNGGEDTAANRSQERAGDKPVPPRELYQGLLKAYKGDLIHGSRTLDESYYHSLADMEDMNHRNSDQVVTKRAQHLRIKAKEGKRPNKSLSKLPMLRVDQLWLWVIDES